MGTCALAATLNDPTELSELGALPTAVSWLAVRANANGALRAGHLRSRFRGRLLRCLQGADTGRNGRGNLDPHPPSACDASEYDLVEIDGRCLGDSAVVDRIPAQRRMVSWTGTAGGASELERIYRRLKRIPARYYRLVCRVDEPHEAWPVIEFQRRRRAGNVIAYASGPAGFWSLVLASQLGAPLIAGRISPGADGDGQPTVRQLVHDYGLPRVRPIRRLYGIVGRSVGGSLSPRLHNEAYRALDVPAVFVPFPTGCFKTFWRHLVSAPALESFGMTIDGLTVASPFKRTVVQCADGGTDLTRRACSGNLAYRTPAGWHADTTDGEAVLAGLAERRIGLRSKEAAVIGCGGSGRAIAAALTEAGARVTLVNRGELRGRFAEQLLGAPFVPLAEFDPRGFTIVVNATPVGTDDDVVVDPDRLPDDAFVIDLVCGERRTPLIESRRRLGRDCMDGHEVLLRQVRRQFQKMTGLAASGAIGERMRRLAGHDRALPARPGATAGAVPVAFARSG